MANYVGAALVDVVAGTCQPRDTRRVSYAGGSLGNAGSMSARAHLQPRPLPLHRPTPCQSRSPGPGRRGHFSRWPSSVWGLPDGQSPRSKAARCHAPLRQPRPQPSWHPDRAAPARKASWHLNCPVPRLDGRVAKVPPATTGAARNRTGGLPFQLALRGRDRAFSSDAAGCGAVARHLAGGGPGRDLVGKLCGGFPSRS